MCPVSRILYLFNEIGLSIFFLGFQDPGKSPFGIFPPPPPPPGPPQPGWGPPPPPSVSIHLILDMIFVCLFVYCGDRFTWVCLEFFVVNLKSFYLFWPWILVIWSQNIAFKNGEKEHAFYFFSSFTRWYQTDHHYLEADLRCLQWSGRQCRQCLLCLQCLQALLERHEILNKSRELLQISILLGRICACAII